MTQLKDLVIQAHGGLDRWQQFNQLSADLMQGGALWTLKGHPDTLARATVTVGLKEQWASHAPFGAGDRRSRFAPDRVAIEDRDGALLEELVQPRSSFADHNLQTPWTALQLAYFAGCAMWTYLNMPFLLAAPGVVCRSVGAWKEKGETWQKLEVTFPPDIATHSTVQTLYVDDAGLLKRHDYDVEIAGNTPGAHYIGGYVEVQGLRFPTERRIYPRQPDGTSLAEPLVVSIDLSDIRLA